MTPIPLDQLGFGWRSHKSAMWWLGLLYRRPKDVHNQLDQMPKLAAAKTGFALYWHNLPYLILWHIVVRIFLINVLGFELTSDSPNFFFSIAGIIPLGIAVGIPYGMARGIAVNIAFGIATAIPRNIIAGSIALGIAAGITRRTAGSIAVGIGLGTVVGILLLVNRTFDIPNGIAAATALMISIPRLYYLPIHLVLIWPKLRAQWYRWHPAAWDLMCGAPYFGLHRLLVAYAEAEPKAGTAEIERLIDEYPQQSKQALRAKTTLIAREAGRTADLTKLADIAAQLPAGDKGFLAQTEEVKEWIAEISGVQMRLNTINRPIFREPAALELCARIETFRNNIAGFREPLKTEFRQAALNWLEIANRQLAEARRGSTGETTAQVFRAGDPANPDSEAFIARYSVIGELEQQVMLSAGCPGLVLYARRRMGKSTILRNLTGFLPTDVLTAFVSMQNPQMFTSVESAVKALHEEIRRCVPSLPADEPPTDLSGFFSFLTACNAELEAKGRRLLLAVDEYETIDAKIGEGVFPLGLLDTLRESIQTHRRITWIFAGSHEIYELKNAAWTSYLVSARTIEVPAFTEAETRLLLTEPMKHSTLWRNNEEKRPRFAASFWGEGGIERIHSEAGGWPHLVQLIAETIVDLVNLEEVSQVTPDLFERALDKSIVRGQNVLYELMRRESTLPGEWDYLLAFKKTETQPPPQDENVAASLRRRLLIAESNNEWRLRVPLMARWLKLRGQ
ncbi:MAG: hypothetical protein SF097_02235 [Acidobacteriota bacterium]|nr:hypothetical protein [Acidobacteriota bacterium]